MLFQLLLLKNSTTLQSNFLTYSLCFFIVSCGSTQTKDHKPTNENIATDANSDAKLKAIQAKVQLRYNEYKRLVVRFYMKGKSEGKSVFYHGKLESFSSDLKNPNVRITIIEPTFKSPLFMMRIKGQKVIQKDIARDLTRHMKLKDFRWIEIFGSVFPFEFFLPVLMGGVPTELFDANTAYVASKKHVRYKGLYYDLIFNIAEEGDINSLYYRNNLKAKKREVVVVQFFGQLKNKKKRSFPGKIKITRSNVRDYILMSFHSLYVK